MGLFDVTRWPAVLLFAGAGLAAVALAFVTVNLFAETMAAFAFVGRHGAEALAVGAARQLVELAGWGALALCAYLGFKVCEVELVFRYFRWAGRTSSRRAMRFRREEGEG